MSLLPKKRPSKYQWRQFFKILTFKEKVIFYFLLFLFLISSLSVTVNLYQKNTKIVPADGGSYIEGVVGSPRYIQPIYAPANDADRDLVELIFSGLVKHGSSGEIVPDLAKEYRILEDGKIWEFYLRENVLWSDGEKLTADDVIFTIKAIQNPDTKNPLRANWVGVETEKISEFGVRFRLKNPSAVFLENCRVQIIPEHIWKEIQPQNFPLSSLNLNPIGTGPYQLKENGLKNDTKGRITSVELVRNPKYYGDRPHLLNISFRFFENEKQLVAAYSKGEINGFSLSSAELFLSEIKINGLNRYNFSIPRYFAVFFNLEKSKALKDDGVRKALNYGTDKEEIIREVLLSNGKIVQSPVLPETYEFNEPSEDYQFNIEKAKELLENAGFKETENGLRQKFVVKTPSFQFKTDLKKGSQGNDVTELQKCLAKDPDVYPEGEITGVFGQKTKDAVIKFQEKYRTEILDPQGLTAGTGDVKGATRTKLNNICFGDLQETVSLEFSLSTVNQPDLIKAANILKTQWEKIGVKLAIKEFNISTLEQDVIKPRNYDIILFGEVLGLTPDPFPFWHSTQSKDPGLNLSMYENKDADRLLEDSRQALDKDRRKELLEDFQEILIEDAPAVFLYTPDYLYFLPKEILGVKSGVIADPSKRLSNISDWYIKTRRAWK